MSKVLDKATAIGAQFLLIVQGKKPYMRFYKRGTWETSRNCMLFWNDVRRRWENSSELSFSHIEYGLKVTGRKYSIIDFDKKTRTEG